MTTEMAPVGPTMPLSAPLGRGQRPVSRAYSPPRRRRRLWRRSSSVSEGELSYSASESSTPSENEPVRRLRRHFARKTKQVSGRGLRITRGSDGQDWSDLQPPPPQTSGDRYRRGSRLSPPCEGEGRSGGDSITHA